MGENSMAQCEGINKKGTKFIMRYWCDENENFTFDESESSKVYTANCKKLIKFPKKKMKNMCN